MVLCANGAWPQPQQSPQLPKGKAQNGVVRFIALGDTGTGEKGQFAVARQMATYHAERPFNMILLLGDNIYPKGAPSELPAKFEKPYADLLKLGVSFRAVLGNHDVDHGGGIGQTNYKPFNMAGQFYYSFVEGNGLVEFFALNSNRMDQTQLAWLEGALSASKARWKIAFFHHPIYSSGKKHGSNKKLRLLLEPLFARYGVSVVFSGHDHIYERTAPQQGVQYFVSGTGGKLRRGDLNRRSPFFIAGDDSVHSFMFVELTRDLLNFWSVGEEGQILDNGVLIPRRSN